MWLSHNLNTEVYTNNSILQHFGDCSPFSGLEKPLLSLWVGLQNQVTWMRDKGAPEEGLEGLRGSHHPPEKEDLHFHP